MRLLVAAVVLWIGASVDAVAAPRVNRSASEADADSPSKPPLLSKKERFLVEKTHRSAVRARHAPTPGAAPRRAVSLHNVWTKEVLPVEVPAAPLDRSKPALAVKPVRGAPPVPLPAVPAAPPPRVVNGFFRDHFTNQATTMDPRLVRAVLAAATRFGAEVVEVVSAYRSPKYNLMLRKKGHAVARESQHPMGQAVDFRLRGLNTKELYNFVRSLHLGGVGYYAHSEFVHADVGPIRTWKGN